MKRTTTQSQMLRTLVLSSLYLSSMTHAQQHQSIAGSVNVELSNLNDNPFGDKVIRTVNKTNKAVEPATKLSVKDKTRLKMLSSMPVYRNISSIMAERGRKLDDNYFPKAPKKHDFSKLPEETAEQKRRKKSAILKAEKKQLEYEVSVELLKLRRNIILGEWPMVKTYMESLPKPVAQVAYSNISSYLASSEQVTPISYLRQGGTARSQQEPVMLISDIKAWLDLPQEAPSPSDLTLIATLLNFEGELPKSFYTSLEKGTRYLGGTDPEARLRAARLLIAANRTAEAKPFLPDLKKALAKKHYEALNLSAKYHQIRVNDEPYAGHLETAWLITRQLLEEEKLPESLTTESMIRAFELLPQLKDKTKGGQWFKDTFAAGKQRGTRLLTFVGTVTSQSKGNKNDRYRLSKIKLQHSTALALMSSAQGDLKPWSDFLTLYAKNWLHEAEYSFLKDKSTSMGPTMERDGFGNVFYREQNYSYNERRENRPIRGGDILRNGPDQEWLSALDELTQLQCYKNYARLYLKMKMDEQAFSFIEKISKINPNESKRFIGELIKVWADNHDPNAGKSYRNSWYYSYGYNERADSIPLTRSKQQRNLLQLKQLVNKLREIGISPADEVELARAFIRCHSQAEIWRMDSFQEIFGKSETLSVNTIAAVLKTMRGNLVRVWPKQKVQKQAKTKRTDIQLQQEVIRGYKSAILLCEQTLERKPEEWKIQLQKAALCYGMNEYLSLIGKNSNAQKKKLEALEMYAQAAKGYHNSLNSHKAQISMEIYENWFYAALGSADLATLKSHHLQSAKEYQKIKTSIESLPPRLAQIQMDQFANSLASRVSGVGPDLKLRYIKAGLSIAGNNERAAEARKLNDYYKDLVTELQIITKVDGSDQIDPSKPFGVMVYLHHSKEIEREAGGFGKYLQNQASNGGYNYGRPAENYRDKFSEKATAALEEHFDIKSITFHKDDVQSYSASKYGWTITPYAYLELQAKGPQVDTIPSLQIDFDFLDTSGYVVIPVSSAKLPIDCNASENATNRPMKDLSITQIFDDRSLDKEGTILLEIKANSHGLIPPIEQVVDLSNLGDFEVTKVDDKGNMVQTLDPASSESPAISERYAIVHLKPKGEIMPKQFNFPTPLLELSQEQDLILQRYEDVDLVKVSSTIDMQPSQRWSNKLIAICAIATLFLIAAVFFIIRSFRKRPTSPEETADAYPIPADLTPVKALSLLNKIRKENTLTEEQNIALEKEIETIMDQHFGGSEQHDNSVLNAALKKWTGLAKA